MSPHLGVMDLKSAIEEAKAVLQYDLGLLKPKKGAIYEDDALKPPLTEEDWTEEDIKKLKSRTLGKSILRLFPFDSGVDSISGATITAVFEPS